MARAPEPLLISAEKPKDTIRIVVLGESAALGDPAPDFGFSRILEVLLEDRIGETHVEVVNASMTAINSHVIVPIAKECSKLKADYWIVYMGNNEVVGPFGPGTVFGTKTPPMWMIRWGLFIKQFKTGQLVESLWAGLNHKKLADARWEGMKMFENNKVRANSEEMERVYENFKSNLGEIIATGVNSGAKVLVCTVAANLKDCAPFASVHREGLSSAIFQDWEQKFKQGKQCMESSDSTNACTYFQHAVNLDPDYAETHFRLAESFMAQGKSNEAKASFQKALDLDALRFRVDSRINRIISETVDEIHSRNAHFLDAHALVSNLSQNGIPGRDLLWEHVHFNWYGNYLLALSLAQKLTDLMPAAVRSNAKKTWLSSEQTSERLAYSKWNELKVSREIESRLKSAPFTAQADNTRQLAFIRNQISLLKPSCVPGALEKQRATYESAISTCSNDWRICANFAQYLREIEDYKAARKQWQKVAELMPFYLAPLYAIGNLYYEMGEIEPAMQRFQETLAQKPNSVEAMNGMSLCFLSLEKTDLALQYAQKALLLEPEDVDVHFNMGFIYARRGQTNEAVNAYETALKIDAEHVKTHINLANLYARMGKTKQAERLFESLLKIAPDNPSANNNWGSFLARQHRQAEALFYFEKAIALNPSYLEARYNLANTLFAFNRKEEAIMHLNKALEQKPDWNLARQRLQQIAR